MTWAAVVVGVGGAAAGVAGSAMSQPKSQSTLSRGQKPVSNDLSLFYQSLFHPYQTHTGMHYAVSGGTPYGGQFLAPLMPQYGQALDMLSSYQPASMSGKQQNLWQQYASGRPSYQAQLDPGTTAKYFQSAVADPMMHQFNTQIAPQIKEGFAGVGAFSSRQGDAQQRALGDLQSNLTGQLGQFQLSNQQEQQRLNAQLYDSAAQRGLGALQGYGQQQLQYANQPLLAAGAYNTVLQGLQQRLDQGQLAQYQDFLRTQPENSPYLSQMLNYIGQQQQGYMQQPNYLSQGISGAGGAMDIWKALQNNQQNPAVSQQNTGANSTGNIQQGGFIYPH